MSTVREIIEGTAEYTCPNCGFAHALSQEYEPANIDSIAIECSHCKTEEMFQDFGIRPRYTGVEWQGHRVRFYEGLVGCGFCSMGLPVDTEEIGEYRRWLVMLLVCSKLDGPCPDAPPIERFK